MSERLHAAPFLRHPDNIKISMADMLVALFPCAVMGTVYYGNRFLMMLGVSVLSALLCELAVSMLTLRRQTIGDLSAVVTGAIIALLLPTTAPVWYAIFASAFAILIVKWMFGGVGKNIFNPAVGGLVSVTLIDPGVMTQYAPQFAQLPLWTTPAADSFTPAVGILGQLKNGVTPSVSVLDLLIGRHPGAPGTVCILVILAAALYLLYRRILSLYIPLGVLGTVALIALLFPRTGDPGMSVLLELCSGGLLFCTFFCASDPVTSPNSVPGKILFGIGIGVMTMLIRYMGDMEDGVLFAILMMNSLSFAMDKVAWRLRPKGGVPSAV